MSAALDKERFGPWALVTGASSGIGKEFARQIAASGATDDLDIGVVVSNAGTGNPGEFLKHDRQSLQAALRLSTMAHLDITHHFGAKLTKRRRGGIILAGAMGAENGVPCMANDGAAKAYVHSLGEALHYEFKPLGVYVTVLAAGFTNTAVLEKFGLDPKTMPMKPMSVEQCVWRRTCLVKGLPASPPLQAPADGQHARQDPGDGRYAATAVRFISTACSLWREAAQAIASSSSAKLIKRV